MILWSGGRFIVAVIAIGALLVVELVIHAWLGVAVLRSYGWVCGIALMVAAVVCRSLGSVLRMEVKRTVTHQDTGEQVTLDSAHRLFFIPLRAWPLMLMSIGVAMVTFSVVG